MLTCEKAESMIDAYLDDDLTNDQKEEFLAHISSCDDCKSALEFAKNVKDTLSTLPEIEVPADFLDGIHERIKAEKNPSKIIYLRRYGALAACLMLAVVMSQAPKMAEYLSNDNPGEIIPPAISTPVPATISEGDTILTPDVTPKVKAVDEFSQSNIESAETNAPVSNESKDTEPENQGIATLSLEDENTENAYDIEISNITISANAEDTKKAVELAELFAVKEQGIYFLDKSSFELLKEAFLENGIEFTLSEEPEGFLICFTITEQ